MNGCDFMDIKEMEDYASKYNIPIMEKEGIEFLTKYIKDNNIKSILEIGTAIGYSAIRMCNVSSDITVTTIERDKERFDIAVNNIKANNLNDRITAIFGDALEVNLSGKYEIVLSIFNSPLVLYTMPVNNFMIVDLPDPFIPFRI